MPGDVLTTKSKIQCPHGGQAILLTSNRKIFARGARALLESDVHTVVGCPFTAGTKYSPCVKIKWSAGANSTTVKGTAVLVKSSIGRCINAEEGLQGVASIVNTQKGVSSR